MAPHGPRFLCNLSRCTHGVLRGVTAGITTVATFAVLGW
jgi:hypothetical protein